ARDAEREEARGPGAPRSRGRARQGDRGDGRHPGAHGAHAPLLRAQGALRGARRGAEPARRDGAAARVAPGQAGARPQGVGGGRGPVTHRPKTAALLAYADGALSDAGRARLERHLARCEVCRRELAAMKLYERMAEDARETPAPEGDYARMELTRARAAPRVSQEIRIGRRRRPRAASARVAASAAGAPALWP